MRTDELRILYLIGGRRIGGTEMHLRRLAAQMATNGRCLVCCLQPSPEYHQLLDDAGVDHVDLGIPSLVAPSAWRSYLAFERTVAHFCPRIVHAYSFAGDVLATLLRLRGFDLEVVTSRRGEDTNRRHHRVRRITNWWSTKIVCVSSEIATFVERTERPGTGLIEVIPNGVPVPLLGRRDQADRVVLRFGTLGTVKPIKGTDLLVDAFMKFPSDAPVQLTIAGLIDRPWAESLRARASVDRRITFIGRAVDPDRFLTDLDVFVLPSRSEGMSNALLEAMALGLPCIATDVGSNKSVLTREHAPPGGIVCAPTADALFSSMDEMFRDATARRRCGDAASDIAKEHYSTETMVNRYRHLYAELMSRGPGSAARTMPRLSSET